MKVVIGALALAGVGLAAPAAFAANVSACVAPVVTGSSFGGTQYNAALDGTFLFSGDIGACTFSVPLEGVPTGVITLYNAAYRGDQELQPGSSATFTVAHDGTTDGTTLVGIGPDQSTNYYNNIVAGTNGTITSTVTMDMTSAVDPADASSIDSVEYAEIARVTLPADETSILTHLSVTGDLLTGLNQKTDGGNDIGLIGGVGSAMFGVTGRYNISEGFSVLGGVSLVNQATNLGTPYNGVIGAGAVRYIEPGGNAFRLFGEGGATLAGLQATFTPATATTATGNLGFATLYGRGGVVIDPDDNNEVTLSATLAESDFGVSAFSMTPAVAIGSQQGFFTTLKGTIQWTANLAPTVDLTAVASVGAVLAQTPVSVAIGGGTPFTASATPPGTVFAEYGARLGWTPVDNLTLDGFVWGSTGTNIGSHNMIGAQAHWKF